MTMNAELREAYVISYETEEIVNENWGMNEWYIISVHNKFCPNKFTLWIYWL